MRAHRGAGRERLGTRHPIASPAANHDMGDLGSGETATVEIANFAYAQPDLTVSARTEVTFTPFSFRHHPAGPESDTSVSGTCAGAVCDHLCPDGHLVNA